MLAASTRAWFEQSLTQRDVSGGFLNRWLLFEGEAEKLLPSPPPVETDAWEDLVLDVGSAVHDAGGFYSLSPQAEGSTPISTVTPAATSIARLLLEQTFTRASWDCFTRS